MSSSIDLSQMSIDCFFRLLDIMPEDTISQKRLKTDFSQSVSTLLETIFFIVWYITDDGDDKYLGWQFLISISSWLLFDFQIAFSQYSYITGKNNDIEFRESWGKIIDLLQNLIPLIYFCFTIQEDNSSMNIGLFVFVAVNFTLDFVSFMHVLCKCELKCCQTWSKVTNHDAGSMLFLFFALVGLILSFVGMYFGYITERDVGRKKSQLILLYGMIGDGLIGVAMFFGLLRNCTKPEKNITWHKTILMIVQGLAFGMCCTFLSLITAVTVIVWFMVQICLALSSATKEAVKTVVKNAVLPASADETNQMNQSNIY